MSKRVVLLFSGQGSQAVGMGLDLAGAFAPAAALFARADEALGFPLSQVMFHGSPEELTRTSRCQPALYVHGLACLEWMRQRVPGLEIAGAAGLSLGEFTAHAAAGTFGFATGLELVARRGQLMEEAAALAEGAMVALIGGDEDAARALAGECGVDVANLNAPGQIVLSGAREGISRAVEAAKAMGFKMAVPLDVAGAYHSRLMRPAQEKLAPLLAAADLQPPSLPVASNFTASLVSDPGEIRRALECQVSGSVRWADCLRLFLARGESLFLELGPDAILAGMMKRVDRSATVLSAGDLASLEAAAAVLQA